LDKELLMEIIDIGINSDLSYLGVLVETVGSPNKELIMNSFSSFEFKKDYYNKAYNDNLELNSFNGIRIVDAYVSDSTQEIADALTSEFWEHKDKCCNCDFYDNLYNNPTDKSEGYCRNMCTKKKYNSNCSGYKKRMVKK